MKKHVDNPCIGYCQLNEDNICKGCGRTVDERTDWLFLTAKQQEKIVTEAKIRLSKIKVLQQN